MDASARPAARDRPPAADTSQPADASRDPDGTEPVIAPLRHAADAQAVVELQQAVWGGPDVTVPTGQLIAAAHVGGTVLVARAGGEAVGFCYGFVGLDTGPSPHQGDAAPGVPGGTLVMWSHMLAVRPAWRGRGLGRRLKRAQADRTRALGLTRILWTFDPLEARNAALNLSRLGALAARYHVDRYGPLDDALNAGMPTDRLVADWYVGEPLPDGLQPVEPLRTRGGSAEAAVVVNPDPPHGRVTDASTLAGAPGELSILVPAREWRGDRGRALAWRSNVRQAFVTAFEAGYVAVRLDPGQELASYRLVRG